ncbi:MAG: transposase [Lachnospiraceae bacterium]|jgi:hypothetical protein|nr:transposase [Lachnospiraceae bacterium]
MAVPEKIRSVQRPINTVVDDNGREGPKRYAVRERASTKYVPGGNPQPRNGKVIGHIIDLKFVPIQPPIAQNGSDILSYGSAALVKSVTQDITADLLRIYPAKDAYAIMAMATLKVIKPKITANRMSTHYRRTFVCKDYPGVSISPNSIGKLLSLIGQDGAKRKQFYQYRMEKVSAKHHIAIDGTLKKDSSTVNDLSAFSRKAKIKGCKEISVLYAYDIELMEPICAQVFPGNSIDASSYPAFIRDNDIRKGIIIDDKGFPPDRIKEELGKRPDLHFLTPIKRNDKRIASYKMLSFEGILQGVDAEVVYKKQQIEGGHFLYAFKDDKKAAAESHAYLAKIKGEKTFDADKYTNKRDLAGVIVFESDQDMDPKTAYQCYDDRWLLEVVFNRYKNDECLDHTNVQGDFSVIGSEFVNFISTVATCRILRKASKVGLFDQMSYGELMDDLSSAWRRVDTYEKPVRNDEHWVHTLVYVFDELEALGLCEPLPKREPKKRGRPKKKVAEEPKPKRPRGRPRKNTDASSAGSL